MTPRFRSWRKARPTLAALWIYVRDDKPFGGKDPPAALFYASRDRRGEHPERHLTNWSGVLQADTFSGYARLYPPDRKPGPIVEGLCWSHARRKFFELADIAANARRGKNAAPISPIALEAVKRIDASSTSSARSTASRPRSGSLRAAQEARRSSPRSKSGRALNAPSSPGTMPSPRPSITCSRAGRPSRGSSKTDASA